MHRTPDGPAGGLEYQLEEQGPVIGWTGTLHPAQAGGRTRSPYPPNKKGISLTWEAA